MLKNEREVRHDELEERKVFSCSKTASVQKLVKQRQSD
jgi:hypothetical protein